MQALETWSEYHKVTLVRTPGRHGIPRNEEADKLAKEGTNGVRSDQTVGIPIAVDKEIRSHWRQEHLKKSGRSVKVTGPSPQ
jgi:hypothetical protein